MLNPKLFIRIWFGSFNQSCCRVVGPHNLGSSARAEVYAEPTEGMRLVGYNMSMLQLMPSSVHPKHMT